MLERIFVRQDECYRRTLDVYQPCARKTDGASSFHEMSYQQVEVASLTFCKQTAADHYQHFFYGDTSAEALLEHSCFGVPDASAVLGDPEFG